MKKIDTYIIRKFLGTFFFAIALLVVIIIIFDISEKFDEFLGRQVPLKAIIFQYYLNFIPYFVNLFSALFTFIAVIWFTSRMAVNTEIVAILTGGISFWRLLVPYLISAVALSVMSFYLSNFLIPQANKRRLAFETAYIEDSSRSRGRDIHVQLKPGVTAYVESFNDHTNIGTKFSLEEIEKGQLKSKLNARYATYDSTSGKWTLQEYFLRRLSNGHEQIEQGYSLDTLLNLRPSDFRFDIKNTETMGFVKLRAFIDQEKVKGSDSVVFYEVEKHRRLAYPYSTLVLTMIGMALSSRKMRGGMGVYLVFGLALAFSYIFFTKISETFATNGDLRPFIAVWIPNTIYTLIAAVLLIKAPK